MKKIYLFLLMFLIPWPIISQESYNETRKLSISLDWGYPINNYSVQLKKKFIDQAYNEPTLCWSFLSPCKSKYDQNPRANSSAYFGIDISYLLPNMKEVGLQISILNNGYITGYHEKYNRLSLSFKKNSFTPYYRIVNLYQKIQFDVGISANFIKVEESRDDISQNYFKPGLMIGWNIGIIEKRSYSLRLTTQANLMMGTVKIGPYEMTNRENGNQEIGFHEEKLWLPEVFLFLSYGRKF